MTMNGTEIEGRSGVVQSVARAFAILELFDAHTTTLTAVEIAERTGLNRATAHRFCQTLTTLGYLQDVGHRQLSPGPKALSLAQSALASWSLPELARPHLVHLQEQTGEAVNLAVLDGTEVVYVVRLLADHLIALRLGVGSRLPAYATSLGRAILAFSPTAEVEDVLRRSDLRPLTPHTITEPEELRAELARIHQRGYALNDQELSLGLRGIAAPVLGARGTAIAAVNVSLPHPLAGGATEQDLVAQVKTCAARIGALAGALPGPPRRL